MTSQSYAQTLTSLNLSAIFGERSLSKRLTNIQDLWVPSGQCFFVDPSGVFKTHEEISGMVDQIQGLGGPDDGFVELSDTECLKHDSETDTWITRVRWGVGTSKDEVKLTGWDVLTIVGGKIKACYTFLDK